jgi:hypothetical protein
MQASEQPPSQLGLIAQSLKKTSVFILSTQHFVLARSAVP